MIGRLVVGFLVLLVACGDEVEPHGDPPEPGQSDRVQTSEEEQAHEIQRLDPEQLERYYLAQVAWVECMGQAGVPLSEPPTLHDFVAGGGAWYAGDELSDDEWNRMVQDETSFSPFNRCGEPPVGSEFAVSRAALERLYAWQVELVACLEAEGFPVDTHIPSLEEFVDSGGTNLVPARDFHNRYGFPQGPDFDRLGARCGNSERQMWFEASDFEVDRRALRAQYEANLALTACLEKAGFVVPDPPPFDEFVAELGWNWTHGDIWGAVYRDNDRDAVREFADRIDQTCPGV